MSTFHWPVRIYYEDTDSGGVVYYANYLKFMERARTEWLRSLGFEQDRLIEEQGIIFAVRSVNADYLKPAHFNDALDVSAEIIEQGKASFSFEQIVSRDGVVLCKGEIKIACLKADTMRPCPIPKIMLMEMQDER
ncbi:tol-pal system-associated acyl-CoA thioesterase [Solemya pervernicosa gill symbiont]|uniref:Tol-pal system-associated acyl-CoA thioesterase n=2 Tax=Gammaproteobacteria incertae sedis TaxID=118884 RepID=A0A1T2L533_9GAMM|nr:tol-pal system-associated acyl-CoA thioesterase [Candidatus Reidiella endopervernicosa]OOZ40150.1 tol-pal system-associated acyl-CoA thioesterase [Solemya pervernicosa gill symbiont]QKQ27467.1 tol-pal system-associated acyl-CoA thioesterase [Candidatus Reidiella endopervernicosa]